MNRPAHAAQPKPSLVESLKRERDRFVALAFCAADVLIEADAECEIVQRLIRNAKIDSVGTVLDLGSGVGFWAEHFAREFEKVIAIEASPPLYEAMVTRCSQYLNATLINDDVLGFEPND